MNAIVKADPPMMTLGYADIERLALSIAKSGLFGMKTPDQAMALMMISQAEGRHPALAARDYDVIQGRPAKKAEAMLRDFLQAGGKVEWHALTDAEAAATFSHPQGGSVRIDWNMARAQAAQLSGKDNWKKFPRQMLRSRCVSEGVRTVWPMATSGMYVPEEAGDIAPPHTGPTIDADPPARTAPPASPDREAINAEVPLHDERRQAAQPAASRYARKAAAYDSAPPDEDRQAMLYGTPEKRAAWIDKLHDALGVCRTIAEVEAIAERGPVLAFLDWCRVNAPADAAAVTAELAQAYGRLAAPGVVTPDDFADTDEVHIKGEEYAAG